MRFIVIWIHSSFPLQMKRKASTFLSLGILANVKNEIVIHNISERMKTEVPFSHLFHLLLWPNYLALLRYQTLLLHLNWYNSEYRGLSFTDEHIAQAQTQSHVSLRDKGCHNWQNHHRKLTYIRRDESGNKLKPKYYAQFLFQYFCHCQF